MMYFLEIIVIVSYIFMHLIETAAFGARAAGRLLNSPALGTTIHHSLFTGSRFMLVLLLPSLGFLVESGINFERYFLIVISSLFLTFLGSYFIMTRINKVQCFFQKLFEFYKDSTIPLALFRAIFKTKKVDMSFVNLHNNITREVLVFKKVLVSFAAYSFLGTGFFMAFLLSLEFIEYRLTLSQFTAVFHGIGAIIVAFYLDPMLSRSIDSIDNDAQWLGNLYSIIFGRVCSYLVTSLLFFFGYLFFYNT